MLFYKGVLISHLSEQYKPGTVTTNFNIAYVWYERISGRKKKGAARHVPHGASCIIAIEYDGVLLEHAEFQRYGIKEHERENCWTSAAKDKAQINTVCKYRILSNEEINNLYSIGV